MVGVYCSGTAEIRHKESRLVYTISSDELAWEEVERAEKPMGLEIHYEAAVEHPELGDLRWGIWEYPVGSEGLRDRSVGGHEVIRDLDYGIESEQP